MFGEVIDTNRSPPSLRFLTTGSLRYATRLPKTGVKGVSCVVFEDLWQHPPDSQRADGYSMGHTTSESSVYFMHFLR